MDKRRRQEGEGGPSNDTRVRESKRARTALHIANEKVLTFEDLPVEISTLILNFAVEGDDVIAVVVLFVCHLWKDIVKHCVNKGKQQNLQHRNEMLCETLATRGQLNLLK